MVSALPSPCQAIIRAYLRLDFGQGRVIAAPYYKNSPHKKRFSDAVDAGKGSPHEIIADVQARAIVHRAPFQEMDATRIRAFMVEQGVGVDCSGFAAHVLNAYTEEKFGNPIEHYLKPLDDSFWRKLVFRMRPFQNINVLTLTSPENAVPVPLSEIQPGDLIRTRGGNHVLLITEAERNDGRLVSISYAHSSGQFGDESGVREGKVNIPDPMRDLAEQEWKEVWQGRIPAREGWIEEGGKNGIFRLKVLRISK